MEIYWSREQLPTPCFGAFSRHLHEGMVRVDALSSNPDLLVTAYENNEKARTVIAANRSTTPQTLIVTWPGTRWKELERVSQYAENAPDTVPDKIVVQPGEIVTLSNDGIGALRLSVALKSK